jgi:TPP-dependent indolepyruvate ferredoxin oxidoreductase alpha subunit
MCSGVDYLSVPEYIPNLEITEPTVEEFQYLQTVIRNPVPMSYIHVLVSNGNRFLVVAAGFKIVENTSDIVDSPFDDIITRAKPIQ